MSEKFDNFISGKEFTKKDIKKALVDNQILGEILDIQYRPLKKIFVKIKDLDHQNYIVKICLSKYSIELSKNENEGYNELNKVSHKPFNFPKYEMITINDLMSISKIQFIDGKKGNFFEFNKFHNLNYKNFYNFLRVHEYVENLKVKIFKNKNIVLPEHIEDLIENFIIKFGNLKIPVDYAHGDCVHYNSIKSSNENYLYDLEYYDKEKILFYDLFHWYTMPYIFRAYRLNKVNFLVSFSKIYYYFIKKYCLYKFRKNNNNLKDLNIHIHLKIFLIEKMLYSLKHLKSNNIENLVSKNQFNLENKCYEILKKILSKMLL